MANAIFPVIDVPSFPKENARYDTKYRRTVKWDVEKGDFAQDGANLMIWCYKIAMTERYACLAYPNEIGVELEAALKEDKHEIAESMIERTITDALKVNPRTESVSNFIFAWNADEMNCTFFVKGIAWDKVFKISI